MFARLPPILERGAASWFPCLTSEPDGTRGEYEAGPNLTADSLRLTVATHERIDELLSHLPAAATTLPSHCLGEYCGWQKRQLI